MSGKLNQMTEQPASLPAMGQHDIGEERAFGNGHATASPLKIFGIAKKKINDIFTQMQGYVRESSSFLNEASSTAPFIDKDCVIQVNQYRDKIHGIAEVLGRDNMKVVFFGRTSNGKSSVINAMLKEKILPTGIGHTTNCFLQVEGGSGKEAYILTEGNDQPQSVESIKHLASALSSVKLDCNSLIRIVWPKEKCRLLQEDVVFVDSPGIDVTADLDDWIDKFCLDADVFVLVANSESTLMRTEKRFFHTVSERLSSPNIFILNNRWDASASEPEMMEEVKSQHLERNIAFLADELKVNTKQEAEDRVFFVSAKEALIHRLHKDIGTPTPPGSMQEGFQVRLFAFSNFEQKFEECISKSAVKTKFAQHTHRGKLITGDLKQIMETVFEDASNKKNESNVTRQETCDKLDYTEKQLAILTSEIKDKIKAMVGTVQRKVSSALNDEIRRLSILVDEYDRPFHPDPLQLNLYKKELHGYLEKAIGRNLQSRCSSALLQSVDNSEKEMTDRLAALLPEDLKQQVANVLPGRDFEVSYQLDCRNMCADFREDIQFRFSFGITALMNRFLGPKASKSALMGYSAMIPRPVPMTPQTPSNEMVPQAADNEIMLAVLSTFASLTSRNTMGAIAVAGLVWKATGWRIMAALGSLYGAVYLYERLTWTNKAKERTFKQQYVTHASSKLKLIVDFTSESCSHQVQQELSSTFARLSHLVDNAKLGLQDEIAGLDAEIKKLDEILKKTKTLKNKAAFLDNELDTFAKQFLKDAT